MAQLPPNAARRRRPRNPDEERVTRLIQNLSTDPASAVKDLEGDLKSGVSVQLVREFLDGAVRVAKRRGIMLDPAVIKVQAELRNRGYQM